MVYYIISDNDRHIDEIVNNLGLITKEKGKDFFAFNTKEYSFGFVEIISAIWRHYRENPAVVFIINAELTLHGENERTKFKGIEWALALRLMNKFRNENNIFLTGFSPLSLVEENSKINFEPYGFIYHQLPLTNEDYSSIIINSRKWNNIDSAKLEEYHLIGLLDDHYGEFKNQICDELNKTDETFYTIIPFDYDLTKPFVLKEKPVSDNENHVIDNFTRIKPWLSYHDVLDLFLLDLNYDFATNKSDVQTQDYDNQVKEDISNSDHIIKKPDVDKQGLNVLQYIDSIGYQTPIAIFSVTKDVEVIKNITIGYHQHIADFIPVVPKTDSHSKRNIDNISDVVKSINKCLSATGAKRNKIGILLTHGTDTMAWTLSLLQYCLKGLKCNVILTGSQIPLKAEFSPSDAPANIIAALHYINQFVPPQIGVSFDMGKKLIGNNLIKVRIWNENAFDGIANARFNWQDIETTYKTLSFNNCVDDLLLLTTGGTIAMNSSHGSTGRPDASAMEKFFESSAAKYRIPDSMKFSFFKSIQSEAISNIDSSEMNPGVYVKILGTFKALNEKYGFADNVETKLRWDVYPIQCSPFMKEEDYFSFARNNSSNQPIVYILMGYGAGNLPYKSNMESGEEGTEHYSPMNFVRKVIDDGNIVILTSHVQQEIPDLDYEVSVKYIEEGVLFGGDMTLAEIMIKSAYLLGQVNDNSCKSLNFLKTSIMAGVGFRSKTSRVKYISLLRKLMNDSKRKEMKEKFNYILPDRNYFKELPYEDMVIDGQVKKGSKSTIIDLINTVSYE